MADPFNCPVCGAHDYGLFASAMIGCPHCMQACIAALEASLKTCRAEAKAEGIREAAAVCDQYIADMEAHTNPGGFVTGPDFNDLEITALIETKRRILALLPPDPPEDKG